MKRSAWTLAATVFVLALSVRTADAQMFEPTRLKDVPDNPTAFGRPLNYWIDVIRGRDPEMMDLAYDAIALMGPSASKAIPELMQIVAEPFVPIRVGTDNMSEVLAKVEVILMKGGAVDCLGMIGKPAAGAVGPVIEWSLATRVLPAEKDPTFESIYIDLVAMDVVERMRGAGAIARFGADAAPAVQDLLESANPEKRKFATAILSEGTLPIVAGLMKSNACADRRLGLAILSDMWPVVAQSHLDTLTRMMDCRTSDTLVAAKAAAER